MKKVLLTATAFALFGMGAMAQSNLVLPKPSKKAITPTSGADASPKQYIRCGTKAPDAEWDKAFNKAVAEWTAAHTDPATGKVALTSYTVAVVVHVIHGGQAVGTFPNLSQAQINSQIQVLNEDYGGVGYQPTPYVQTYFNTYASTPSNSVAAASINSSGGIAIANCGITFCMATKDPSGNTLAEPGIDRVNYVTKGWNNPASSTYNSANALQSYIDGTIKPGTIWDINKYLNMWVTDENSSAGLLGYGTFPAGTGLPGLSAPYGTTTTDGFWAYAKAFGSKNIYPSGTYDATYNLGRTCSHELGHCLGLRHTWGDGTCATDYCNDTPPESAANYNCGTYPYQAGTCTGNSPNGVMWMNIMDYSPDNCMYMFTNDQAYRVQTTMANGTYRKNLTTYAATECSTTSSTVAPTAAFTPPSGVCVGVAKAFSDASTGSPTSWTWSVTPSTATITTSTSQNPTITFGAANTYTVSLTATNANGSNSVSHTLTVTSCTTSSCDTVSNMLATDTLTIYTVDKGYLSGSGGLATNTATPTTITMTNVAVGEVYSSSSFPTNVTQVKGAMILFYRNVASNIGTKGTTSSITVAMTNTATSAYGTIPGTTTSASQTVSVASIATAATTAGVNYAGNTLFDYTGYMIAYPVMFSSSVTMPAGFALTVTTPTAVAADSIAIWSNSGTTQSTATGCVKLKSGTSTTWYNASVFGIYPSFAIIPIACPASTGIESNELGSNITLFPNPNNGSFNIAVTVPKATNLSFTIVNTLGQVVYSRSENNITNTVLSCDLSGLARGVYYANITDGSGNRTVKKIVIE